MGQPRFTLQSAPESNRLCCTTYLVMLTFECLCTDGFFWMLYQDGTIEHEVKLTGILSTNGLSQGEGPQPDYGVLMAPGLNAQVQHCCDRAAAALLERRQKMCHVFCYFLWPSLHLILVCLVAQANLQPAHSRPYACQSRCSVLVQIHQHFFNVRLDMAVDDENGGAALTAVEVRKLHPPLYVLAP